MYEEEGGGRGLGSMHYPLRAVLGGVIVTFVHDCTYFYSRLNSNFSLLFFKRLAVGSTPEDVLLASSIVCASSVLFCITEQSIIGRRS